MDSFDLTIRKFITYYRDCPFSRFFGLNLRTYDEAWFKYVARYHGSPPFERATEIFCMLFAECRRLRD